MHELKATIRDRIFQHRRRHGNYLQARTRKRSRQMVARPRRRSVRLQRARLRRRNRATVARLGVRILLEPGRFLVGNAGVLLTRVRYIKQAGAKKFAIVDAGMNDLIRPALYQSYHEIVPVRKSRTTRHEPERGKGRCGRAGVRKRRFLCAGPRDAGNARGGSGSRS